jgi:hypothetical protein
MKKYLIPTIGSVVVAALIFVRYEIVSPARAAARDLDAINGITVGKTTEAEWLGRPAFQKMDLQCFTGDCFYHTERTNRFLGRLGLAPRTLVNTIVMVRDGMVTEVSVFMSNGTRPPLTLSQRMTLLPGCASSPCVKPVVLPTKVMVNIMILFNNESEFRNRMPEAVQTACLSRIHGCSTYDELTPLAKGLNLDTIARSSK